jgi:hypothetical protein
MAASSPRPPGLLGAGSAPSFEAPASWRAIDLLSDLHLAENTPEVFEAWAAHLRNTDAIEYEPIERGPLPGEILVRAAQCPPRTLLRIYWRLDR